MTVSSSPLVFPPFRLELETDTLWHDQQQRQLRPQVVALLHYLFTHAGLVVTKAELLSALWPGTTVSDGLLKTYIWEIRQALEESHAEPRFIETIPKRGYRFIEKVASSQYSVASSLPPPTQSSALSPQHSALVGREPELTHLHNSLARALTGERQIVCVTGEAGIGKTSLVDTFVRQAGAHAKLWIAHGQCIERYGTNEAYLPVLEALGRLGRESGRKRLTHVLRKYAPTWLVQLPALIDTDECGLLQHSLQHVTHKRMLREVADALTVLTAEQPLVLVLEDLHWSDPSTLDLLSLLARQHDRAQLLIIGTYRLVDILGNGHPLRTIVQELSAHRQCNELRVGSLSETDMAEYLGERFAVGAHSCAPLRRLAHAIHQRTEGNPLFMVNAVDYLLAQGAITHVDGQWDLSRAVAKVQHGVPPNIQQLIERQIDQLSPEDQRVLEVASVAGAEFSAAAVAAGLAVAAEEGESQCAELARRALFLQPTGTAEWPNGTVTTCYGFRHALYQHVLYERLPAGRRIALHQRIGERLEQAYGTRTREVAAELALHFERGREEEKAVHYLHQAGENAIRRMAYTEAHALLRQGLGLLERGPRSRRQLRQEAMLCQTLITPLLILKGYAAPEVAHVCTRARDLYQQLGETPQLSLVWGGLYSFYFNRAEIQTACDFARRYLHLAQKSDTEKDLVWAQVSLGHVLYHVGEFTLARTHLQHGLSLYDARSHHLYASDFVQDPGVQGRSALACVLWCLGYADQALQHAQAALALARNLSHPPSLAFALVMNSIFYSWLQEWSTVFTLGEELIAMVDGHDLAHWRAMAIMERGWILIGQGQFAEAISHMRRAIGMLQDMGTRLSIPGYLFYIAGAQGAANQLDEAVGTVTEALILVETTSEYLTQSALYRFKGDLLLMQNRNKEMDAERCFHKALTIAHHQGAKSLELRATMSLACLWQQQGKHSVAHNVLSTIYNWFTEGFDTADLQEARGLLDKL